MSDNAFGSVAFITRPNDTSPYSAGDVIGSSTGSTAAIQFVAVGPSIVSQVMITTVQLEIDVASVPSGMTSFTLHLYSATPPSAYGDNASWDLPAGDRPYYLGYVLLGTPVDVGSTLYVETVQYNKQTTMPGSVSGSLWAYLVTNGAYTPTASAVYKPTLHSMGL